MPGFLIGFETSEYVAVETAASPDSPSTDYWDGNWLRCDISVAVQGFRGSIHASLRREELVRFPDQLRVPAKPSSKRWEGVSL